MRTFIAAALLCLVASVASAHGLRHTATTGESVVVTLAHEDDSPFSFESYEVFRPGETTPFQVGRTDAHGRLAFVPDVDGDWRVRAFSADGHGADFAVPASATPGPTAAPGRLQRIVTGVCVIFGIFGIVVLFARKRTA